VQVAEGAVLFRPDHEAVTVHKGMALISTDREDRLILRPVAPENVGSWRANRLTFQQATLRSVAAAVGRTTGAKLAVTDELAERPFTGTIRLGSGSASDMAHLAALTGTLLHRKAGRWMLTSVADAPR
jgi:ferric-dicitrate binding protein FerR (iron transport regulator)